MSDFCEVKECVQLDRVYILLRTPNLGATKAFYEKVHHFIDPTGSLQNSQEMSLLIEPFDQAQAGFVFVGQEERHKNEIQDPDRRPIQLFSRDSDLATRFHTFSLPVSAVLRSASIEKTKDFYTSYGKCTEEFSDQAPRHYSIDWEGPFTEIYPERIYNSRSVELLFQATDLPFALKTIREHRICVHTFDNSHILISDPEDRPVRIIRI
jgi:hypothetical protein